MTWTPDWDPDDTGDDELDGWLSRSGCVLALICAVATGAAVAAAVYGVAAWLGP